ncbi:hypothetical protein BDC45DRAFT_531266 [Circinella umbellata]|nr:hypothetical protein BDC45DRAFT_531266 [Circinella umbellata]
MGQETTFNKLQCLQSSGRTGSLCDALDTLRYKAHHMKLFNEASGCTERSTKTYDHPETPTGRERLGLFIVPKEKLLVLGLGEGWGPLCQFLNKPIPDIEYPHVNTTADMLERIENKYG